jgi:hypothetical protein
MKMIVSTLFMMLSSFLWADPVPSVALSTISFGYPFVSSFQIKINFSEAVTGFDKDNINITNGMVENVTGNNTGFLATVIAILPGEVKMFIPAHSVKSLTTGTDNLVSNTLKVMALDPNLNPSSNFDLSQWLLTLPIPLGDINSAIVVSTPILNGIPSINTGYSNPPYFYTDVVTGAMVFFAPLNGATTNNSVYPRSQLAEYLPGGNHHWKLSSFESNTLTASVQINQMPLSKKIVIGAIQDDGTTDPFGNEVGKKSLVKLYYDLNELDPNKNTCNGCIYAQVRPTPAQENFLYKPVTIGKNIHMNKYFTYKLLLMNDGTLKVTLNGSDSSTIKSAIVKLSTSKNNLNGWGSQSLYFQAGVYVPANGKSDYLGGTVSFYALQVKHTPKGKNVG